MYEIFVLHVIITVLVIQLTALHTQTVRFSRFVRIFLPSAKFLQYGPFTAYDFVQNSIKLVSTSKWIDTFKENKKRLTTKKTRLIRDESLEEMVRLTQYR